MTGLPAISGQQCIKALKKIGFTIRRQRGSHIVIRRDNPFTQLVIPDHKELAPGTLRAIIRQAGLTVSEFVNLLS